MYDCGEEKRRPCGWLRKELETQERERNRIAAWACAGSGSFTLACWLYLNLFLGLGIPWWTWVLCAVAGVGMLGGKMERNRRDRKFERLIEEALPERELPSFNPNPRPRVLPPKAGR